MFLYNTHHINLLPSDILFPPNKAAISSLIFFNSSSTLLIGILRARLLFLTSGLIKFLLPNLTLTLGIRTGGNLIGGRVTGGRVIGGRVIRGRVIGGRVGSVIGRVGSVNGRKLSGDSRLAPHDLRS